MSENNPKNTKNPKPLREGMVKKGGVNQKPKTPRPQGKPVGQGDKPGPSNPPKKKP
jgi:hypothetical protein